MLSNLFMVLAATLLSGLLAPTHAKGKGGSTPMDARAELGDAVSLSAPVMTGDTTGLPFPNCKGTELPDNPSRGFYAFLGDCLVDITLPGKDGNLDTPEDNVALESAGIGARRDKKTGAVVGVFISFTDPNFVKYATDFISVSPPSFPSPGGFTIHVHENEAEVRRQGSKKKKPVVGKVSVGDIVYTPKP